MERFGKLMYEEPMEELEEFKYLGVWFDKKL